MGRLHTSAPRLRKVGTTLKAASTPDANYGKGRGGRPWRRKRLDVFARDLYTCKHCGRTFPPERLACDHITPQSQGGTDEPDNLQTLCDGPGSCHEAKTKTEMGAQREGSTINRLSTGA
jgi:5-methylcytosine-specific restriction protein A